MPRNTPLTPAQVKAALRRRGKTITQWAREREYTRREVYRVLNGVTKGHYGRAYEIAVALGLVVPEDEPSTASARRNHQSAAAA